MICVHFKCRREDLPAMVGMPPGLKMPCAHVNASGEPCPESPVGIYDLETLQLIVAEDALWGPEFKPGQAVDGTTAQADKAATATPEESRSGSSDTLVPEGSIPSPGTEKRRTKKPAKAAKKAPPAATKDEEDLDNWEP